MATNKITVTIWVAWVHEGCEYSWGQKHDNATSVTSAITRAVGHVFRMWDNAEIVAVLVNPTNEQIHNAVFHVVAKRGIAQ